MVFLLHDQTKYTQHGRLQPPEKKKSLNTTTIEDEVLLKLRRARNNRTFKQLVVPQALKLQVLAICHDNFTGGHLVEKKTWIKLSNRFYWTNSRAETLNYNVSHAQKSNVHQQPEHHFNR
jgi:hypothetical protein